MSLPAASLCSSSSGHWSRWQARSGRPVRQRCIIWSCQSTVYLYQLVYIISVPVTFLWCLGTVDPDPPRSGGVSGSASQPPLDSALCPGACRLCPPGSALPRPGHINHNDARTKMPLQLPVQSHSGGDVTHQQKQVTATLHGFFPGVVLTPCRRGRHAGHRKEVAPAERTRSAGTT